MPIITGPAGMDPILGEMRTIDISGGTGGGGDYTFNSSDFTVSITGLVSLKNIPVSKVVGAVTGIEASVNGGTATITATGSTTSVKLVGVDGTTVSEGVNDEIQISADTRTLQNEKIAQRLKTARFVPATSYGGATGTGLTLLHFSDIHYDPAALGRIMADRAYFGSLVDDAICTGDMVSAYRGPIASWWNATVMTVIGNHETLYQWRDESNVVHTDYVSITMAQRDTYYIAPFEANWGITHTSGTSYYYKDYPTHNVRLVAIDVMCYLNSDGSVNTDPSGDGATQTAWLADLLSDAITKNLHVAIAVHWPKHLSLPVGTTFTKYDLGIYNNAINVLPITPTVATAIAGGLKFVGYLCGHLHQDDVWDVTGDRTQFAYDVTCANVVDVTKWGTTDQFRDPTLDAYNLVTIDTKNNLVKIIRGGGADIDTRMRDRHDICFNYNSHTIIENWNATSSGGGEGGDVTITPGFRTEVVSGTTVGQKRFFDIEPTVTGGTCTLRAGYAYRIYATSSAITLDTEPIGENQFGLEGHANILLANSAYIITTSNVVIPNPLQPNAVNNCTLHFHEGKCYIDIEDHGGARIVSVSGGTDTNSLYYWCTQETTADSNTKYIGFNAALAGTPISFEDAIVNGEKNLVGNGSQTLLTGNVSCSSKTVVTNCALSDVGVTGGTMYLDGAYVPAGKSVTNSGGHMMLTNVCGGGGTINVNSSYYRTVNSSVNHISGVTITGANDAAMFLTGYTSNYISGCIFSGNSNDDRGGAIPMYNPKFVEITGCTFTNNSCAGSGGAVAVTGIANGGSCTFTDCVFENNSCSYGGAFFYTTNAASPGVDFVRCKFANNSGGYGAIFMPTQTGGNPVVTLTDCEIGSGQRVYGRSGTTIELAGSNTIDGIFKAITWTDYGTVIVSSGAILNFFNNANATPLDATGGSIQVQDGGCQVIVSSGGTSATVNIASGTYTKINKDGTTA